jgi:hypothetical protein
MKDSKVLSTMLQDHLSEEGLENVTISKAGEFVGHVV